MNPVLGIPATGTPIREEKVISFLLTAIHPLSFAIVAPTDSNVGI